MANFADDFDETPEDDISGPILPREDRLWRHPSELNKDDPSSLDPIAVRRRWLQTQPTRASAWTAGLVGALLASGLVVLGTHLASALTGDSSPPAPTLSSISVTPNASTPGSQPSIGGLGATVSSAVTRVSGAMARFRVTIDDAPSQELGLIVNSSGFLVMPIPAQNEASSILVTLNDGVEYVGEVVGADAKLGIDLVHINGATKLPTVSFARGRALQARSLAIAITSTTGATQIGSLQRFAHDPTLNSTTITGALTTDLNPIAVPIGSAMLDGSGRVSGFVVGTSGGQLVVTSGTQMRVAIAGLMSAQVLSTHVIGVTCTDHSATSTVPAGAEIRTVAVGSAAAAAGLKPGDIVVGVNGVTVTSRSTFESALHTASPKAPLLLTVDSATTSGTVVIPASIAASP